MAVNRRNATGRDPKLRDEAAAFREILGRSRFAGAGGLASLGSRPWSTNSATDHSVLFVGFVHHRARFLVLSMRAWRVYPRSNSRSPGSRAKSFHTCQGPRSRRHPVSSCVRDSMAGLCAPPKLRRRPRGYQRINWGRCGLPLLHRSGVAPPTLCRILDESGYNARPRPRPRLAILISYVL